MDRKSDIAYEPVYEYSSQVRSNLYMYLEGGEVPNFA